MYEKGVANICIIIYHIHYICIMFINVSFLGLCQVYLQIPPFQFFTHLDKILQLQCYSIHTIKNINIYYDCK